MSSVRIALSWILVLGCGADDGDEGAAETGDGSGSTTSGSATDTMPTATATDTMPTATATDTMPTASGSSSGGDDGPVETGDDAPASSDGAEAPSDSSGPAESTGGAATCEPDAEDDACRECVKANCCGAWTACQDDEICACTIDCHLAGASLGSCKNQCGGDVETYEAVYFCGQMFCLGTCDWDCC
jgi:hypothetical protein